MRAHPFPAQWGCLGRGVVARRHRAGYPWSSGKDTAVGGMPGTSPGYCGARPRGRIDALAGRCSARVLVDTAHRSYRLLQFAFRLLASTDQAMSTVLSNRSYQLAL